MNCWTPNVGAGSTVPEGTLNLGFSSEVKYDVSAVREALLSAHISDTVSTAVLTEVAVADEQKATLGAIHDALLKHGVSSADVANVQSFLDMGPVARGVVYPPPSPSPSPSPSASASPVWELHLHRSPAGFVDATQEEVDASCLVKEELLRPAPPGYLRFAYLIDTNLERLTLEGAPLVHAITRERRLPVPDGEVLEFGSGAVYSGQSITWVATALPNMTVHGFTSVEGVPENWIRGNNVSADRPRPGCPPAKGEAAPAKPSV